MTSTCRSSAPPSPSAPAGPINITLNANGINDPAKLARLLEPAGGDDEAVDAIDLF